MSRLAALASQYVGRRVKLRTGQTATISRVTARGFTVTIGGVTAADIAEWID